MLRILNLLLPLIISSFCFGQFNDSVFYHLKFASTGIINKTNDGNSYVLNNSLGFDTKKKEISFNTGASWIYGSQQKNLTNNDFAIHGAIDIGKKVHKLYYWGLLNYEKSYSLKINHRLQAGAGIAYNIIDSPFLKINVSDGVLYEQGDLIDANLGHDIYNIPRNSFRLLYHWSLKDKLVIDGVHFYQPSFKDVSDYIIQSTNNVSVKLKEWLSITASLIYNKVSRTKRENLLITYGLVLEKYF